MLCCPIAHEPREFGIAALRQNHLEGHVLVTARTVGTWRALALEAQDAPGIGVDRDGHVDRSCRRWHRHFATEHSFPQRHRQVEVDVIALAPKEGMGRNMNLDERVAGGAAVAAGRTLSW